MTRIVLVLVGGALVLVVTVMLVSLHGGGEDELSDHGDGLGASSAADTTAHPRPGGGAAGKQLELTPGMVSVGNVELSAEDREILNRGTIGDVEGLLEQQQLEPAMKKVAQLRVLLHEWRQKLATGQAAGSLTGQRAVAIERKIVALERQLAGAIRVVERLGRTSK